MMEIIYHEIKRGHIRCALFDFDGTLSLIREGWQQVMAQAMLAELLPTPNRDSEPELRSYIAELVAHTTGQTTSYQMARLAAEVYKRGGRPEDPLVYKQRYLKQLGERINSRVEAIKSGRVLPDEMTVPGARAMLEEMRARGVRCYLVSGTYEPYVLDEAEVLQITAYFEGIYGGQDDPTSFSKKHFMDQLIADQDLDHNEFVSLGDGVTEIIETKLAGGIAVGVASNEATRTGIDERKRELLIQAGADIIVPDFREHQELVAYLFEEDKDLTPGR
jgi:phosphoglycolate phosphatase-like HAD superfamily hydrolase